MSRDYFIECMPKFATVGVGATVRYTLRGGQEVMDAQGRVSTWDDIVWYWQPDRNLDGDLDEKPRFKRATPRHVCDIEFGETARNAEWTVWAKVTQGSQEYFVPFHQKVKVETAESVLFTEMAAAARAIQAGKAPTPSTVLAATRQYIRTLRQVGEAVPPRSGKDADEHAARLKRLEKLRDAIAASFAPHNNSDVYPLAAAYLERASQQRVALRGSLVRLAPSGSMKRWAVIDWTDPLDARLSGTYEGSGTTDQEAIRKAIEAWNEDCKYPPGDISYQVPKGIGFPPEMRQGQFETGEKGVWERIADFLGIVGTAAALIAGVVAFLLPVPGSQLVSVAIWTSVIASSAAAIINITTTDQSWREDALDGLTVVSNLFMVGSIWARGCTILAKNTANNVARYAFIGQVTADTIDGVIASAEIIAEFDQIMGDRTLLPDERIRRLLAVLGRGAIQSISIRATAADIKALRLPDRAGLSPAERINEFKDTSKVVDLTGTPTPEGTTTKSAGHTTTVQKDPARARAKAKAKPDPPKSKPRNVPSPASGGMRDLDDKTFADFAKEHKMWIFVREGNADGLPYMGKPGYAGKPESLKAKTADEGPHKGLACYDPNHRKTQRFLAELKGEKKLSVDDLMGGRTVEQHMADPDSEFRRRYELYEKEIKVGGFVVRKDDGYVVEQPTAKGPVRFHGDYDLHGVYKADGQFIEDTKAVRESLNFRMRAELIRHGAHDEWKARNDFAKSGANFGPRPPCFVYGPDGTRYWVGVTPAEKMAFRKGFGFDEDALLKRNREIYKVFIEEHGLQWRYAEFEKAKAGYPIDSNP
ncbi:MAG: hypothetical protein R3B68_02925 [Phycisphaerales bacterium]